MPATGRKDQDTIKIQNHLQRLHRQQRDQEFNDLALALVERGFQLYTNIEREQIMLVKPKDVSKVSLARLLRKE